MLLRGAERIWPPSGARAQRGRWSEAQRSGAKWRGRGLGQRNTGFEKKLQYKQKKENSGFKKKLSVKHAINLCCAARGHALAVCHLLAALVRQTCSARAQHIFFSTLYNKKSVFT